MKFLDKLLDLWRAKEEKKIEVVPKPSPRVLSVREMLDLGLRVKRMEALQAHWRAAVMD